MNRLVVAITLVAASISSGVVAQQRQPHVPQKYRTTDAPTLLAKAKAGDSEAMLWLGIKFDSGRDLPQDHVQATEWYRKAADLGLGSGMFFVGVAYWSGRGVTQNFVEAYKWLDLASKHGNDAERERSIGARDSLARVMSPEMINRARSLEADWEKDFQKRKK